MFAQNEYRIEFYFYSLFDRINYIPYFTRIWNKKLNNVFVPYSLFYKIDVMLGYPAVSWSSHSPNQDSPKAASPNDDLPNADSPNVEPPNFIYPMPIRRMRNR